MNGKLNDQPLAELICEIGSKVLSGALRLEHEQAKTVIYFEKGQIVFAASNIRTLRLREYLKKKGLLSEKEAAGLGNPAVDLKLASSWVAEGKLSKKDFDLLRATLLADILRVALLWTEGTWELDERARLNDPVQVKINPAGLLKEAAHRLPLKFVSLRFRNPTEMISRSTEVGTTNSFLPSESFILSRLDVPLKLEELVAVSGLRDLDAYRVIYGLVLGGFLRREYWQNAFRTESPKGSPVTPPTTPRILPETETVKPEATDHWAAAKEKSSEDNLGDFLERMRAASTYYEVLDVQLNAGVNEIKEAYYGLARSYHPDRFHLKSGTRLHEQISSAFARITQAYETLTDAKARSTYDATIERSKEFERTAPKSTREHPSAESTSQDFSEPDPAKSGFEQAEAYFREGFGSLQQGQINTAITNLSAASRMFPNEARYRAYYGQALAAEERTRRLAESEMQTAVKLEPGNALYRTMLAQLYFDLKFHRRAQTELDRALELDPNNAKAVILLRKLEKLRKVGE